MKRKRKALGKREWIVAKVPLEKVKAEALDWWSAHRPVDAPTANLAAVPAPAETYGAKGSGSTSATVTRLTSHDLAVSSMADVLVQIFPKYDWDDSLQRTAERFVQYLEEHRPEPHIQFNFTTFKAEVNQLVVIRDIEFSSICKHHLLPFHGIAHLGYIPASGGLMVGASKIPRLVEFWARRPQTQELLTEEIAADFKHRTGAFGVAVQLIATHTCMSCRGIRKVGASMVTEELRGVLLTDPSARMEWLFALQAGRK